MKLELKEIEKWGTLRKTKWGLVETAYNCREKVEWMPVGVHFILETQPLTETTALTERWISINLTE